MKLMNTFYTSLLFLASSLSTFAQSEKGLIKLDSEPGGIIEATPLTKGHTVGSVYYLPEWANGDVQLSKVRVLSNQVLRYDIFHNTIELKSINTKKVFLIMCSDVISFNMIDTSKTNHKFVNTKQYNSLEKKNAKTLMGFFEILVDGEEIELLSKIDTKILRSNYNAALNVGDKNDQVVQREDFYFYKNNTLREIPKRKKAFLEYFQTETNKLQQFIKDNKLKITEREDLIRIIEFLNKNSM